MGESFSGKPPLKPQEDRLDSWKEIATYLKRDVTTVQRWEKREGMPVQRHLHGRMGSVYAYRSDLDAWVLSRNTRVADEIEGASRSATNLQPSSTSLPSSLIRRETAWLLLVTSAVVIAAILWLQRSEYFWRSPLAEARFQTITDVDGVAQAAAISPDGHFVAFLSDRDGKTDVWITQVGSGQFHNLTNGSAPELVNPSIRVLGFSPDSALVTYWVRKQNVSAGGDISIWGVPTLGGQPRPYLPGVAEFDWSHDGSRLAYHTPGPGDPLFVSDGIPPTKGSPIFTAPAGMHSHFPLWSPDAAFLYFVQGSLPDKLDIFRIPPNGGVPQRITTQTGLVSHPVFLDRRTLLYLAGDIDGLGPWLRSLDVERRIPHQLTSGLERYTSLASSADGRRLVATRATPKRTLWRLPIADSSAESSPPARISLTTTAGFSPRLGANFLLYVSANGASESIWKLADGNSTELWSGKDAQILGAPAISADGKQIAFSARERGQKLLYVVQIDGTNPRIVTSALDLQGSPAWSPDGQSVVLAADDHGLPHLFRIPLDGSAPSILVQDYSTDPASSPDGRLIIYSGPDIGTVFSVKAVSAAPVAHPLPSLTLTRGARHLTFLPDGKALMFLQGEIQHKNLWRMDLDTGDVRQITHLPNDFDVNDFDISADGREVVLERLQEHSDVVLLDLPRP